MGGGGTPIPLPLHVVIIDQTLSFPTNTDLKSTIRKVTLSTDLLQKRNPNHWHMADNDILLMYLFGPVMSPGIVL